MRSAIVSGNVARDTPLSYWPIFSLFLPVVRVPEVFAKQLTRPSFRLVFKVQMQNHIHSDCLFLVFQVPNGIGVILGSAQLLLFVIYPSTAQRTITYDMKLPKPVQTPINTLGYFKSVMAVSVLVKTAYSLCSRCFLVMRRARQNLLKYKL